MKRHIFWMKKNACTYFQSDRRIFGSHGSHKQLSTSYKSHMWLGWIKYFFYVYITVAFTIFYQNYILTVVGNMHYWSFVITSSGKVPLTSFLVLCNWLAEVRFPGGDGTGTDSGVLPGGVGARCDARLYADTDLTCWAHHDFHLII